MTETTENWRANKGDFWGTPNQHTKCARCGGPIICSRNEPMNVFNIFKPSVYFLCNECFDKLPDD